MCSSCCHGYICTAASITSNIDGEACQGEKLVLACTGRRAIHRWTLETESSVSPAVHMVYRIGDEPETITVTVPGGLYIINFTLVSATQNQFESTVSTVLTNTMNNTVVECGDSDSEEATIIRIAGSINKLISEILLLQTPLGHAADQKFFLISEVSSFRFVPLHCGKIQRLNTLL